jgi:hypothetical protein
MTAVRSVGIGNAALNTGTCQTASPSGSGTFTCDADIATDPSWPTVQLRYVCPTGTVAMQLSCATPLDTTTGAPVAGAALLSFVQDGADAHCIWQMPAGATGVLTTIAAICADLSLTIT